MNKKLKVVLQVVGNVICKDLNPKNYIKENLKEKV